MYQQRIVAINRALRGLPSRRDLLRGLAAAGLGFAPLPAFVAARKRKRKNKRKEKKRQPRPVINRFGCADVGQPCYGDSSVCCSGLCAGKPPKQGKPDRRVCAAHDAANCLAEMDRCTTGADVFCNPGRVCLRTTGNAGFCGGLGEIEPLNCQACARDTDCEALGFGEGAACVVLDGACSAICPATGGLACLPAGT